MNSKTKDILSKLEAAARAVPRTTFKHYKGGLYRVKDHVINTTTGDVDILYQRIDGPEYDYADEMSIMWVRPMAEWYDEVTHNDVTTTRFVQVRSRQVTQWVEVDNR